MLISRFMKLVTLALWLATLLAFHSITLIPGCSTGSQGSPPPADPARQAERDRMVEQQVLPRGINNPAVIAAMRRVPRHRFVPDTYASIAYADGTLPIGHDQTITQPSLVAFMTEALALRGHEKVLEIGTGSGYQAAVLAEIASKVYSIEIIEPLANRATRTLAELGYNNVTVRVGDGYLGWPSEAPFDAIIVTAAPDHVPQPLLDQLAVGGRLIIPVGEFFFQRLILIQRTAKGYEHTELVPVLFVPMTREKQAADVVQHP